MLDWWGGGEILLALDFPGSYDLRRLGYQGFPGKLAVTLIL
jgi:hypothetical protein